jgi:hypothetical protein
MPFEAFRALREHAPVAWHPHGDDTGNLVSAGTLALLQHPEERARLVADPGLLPTAIEEMLRLTTPVTVFARTATKDTEVRGVPIAKGERVAVFYPSANRDGTRFADRDRFDVARDPNPHLGFRWRWHPLLSGSKPGQGGGRPRRTGPLGIDERHQVDASAVHGGLGSSDEYWNAGHHPDRAAPPARIRRDPQAAVVDAARAPATACSICPARLGWTVSTTAWVRPRPVRSTRWGARSASGGRTRIPTSRPQLDGP